MLRVLTGQFLDLSKQNTWRCMKMAIEAIKGAGMAFQGSASSSAMRAESAPRVESASNVAASDAIAHNTVEISTKGADADGGGNGGAGNQQMPTNEQLKRAVEEINKKANNSEAIFGVHEDTNRITIKIVDKESKEVIKEFPPEKTLDMIAKVWEMAGLMVDEKR